MGVVIGHKSGMRGRGLEGLSLASEVVGATFAGFTSVRREGCVQGRGMTCDASSASKRSAAASAAAFFAAPPVT